MKNLVIWIIGGSSVGKTTQARLIHKFFSKISKEEIKLHVFRKGELKYFFTGFNSMSCNLGDLTRGACAGTDTLGKKEQVVLAVKKARQHYPVIVAEGIMATAKYMDFLKDENTILFTIHLNVSEKVNFQRLKQRRGVKLGIPPEDVEITEKTKLNLIGKIKGFQSLYNRVKDLSDYHMSIDTDKFSALEISIKIGNQIINLFESENKF